MEIKDKPDSMSVRDWITKKVATGIIIPENVINKVISHQFTSAIEAMSTNNSLEISGFGKFYFNVKKANKEIRHVESQKQMLEERLAKATTEKERLEIEQRIKYQEKRLSWLNQKKL